MQIGAGYEPPSVVLAPLCPKQKELNRCLPCRNCGQRPVKSASCYYGCPEWKDGSTKTGSCHREFVNETRTLEESFKGFRLRWNRLQKNTCYISIPDADAYKAMKDVQKDYEEKYQGQALPEVIDLATWQAYYKVSLASARKLIAQARGHVVKLQQLSEFRKEKIKSLNQEIQKLKAKIERLEKSESSRSNNS